MMFDFLRDPIWEGIGAVVAVLSLILYLIVEWEKIVSRWRTAKKLLEKLRAFVPTRLSPLIAFLLGGWFVGVLLFVTALILPPLGGKIAPGPSFSIGKEYYHGSGKMGDIGDVDIAPSAEWDHFTYGALGRGPHEWEWKYIKKTDKCELNSELARFGGVYYLDPPGNWGEKPGFDLRGIRRVLKWEARSVTGAVIVEFIVGGVDWKWDEKQCDKVSPPWPDSMPRTTVGRATLTDNWQSFTYDLSKMPEGNFKNLIGGFAWVIAWGSNGIELNQERTGPVQPKTFVIEIRNIRYER